MEQRGAVNEYRPYKAAGEPIFVINLSSGVTPFIHFFNGAEYCSGCYRLTRPQSVTVAAAHYRPTKEEFDRLKKDLQDYVLNGGLLCEPLEQARPLAGDPVGADWDYERFQEWCKNYYGRRLPKMAASTKGA